MMKHTKSSSYFLNFDREVAEARKSTPDNDEFLARVAELEDRMFTDVIAISGDIEFPSTYREAMLAAFALYSVRRIAPTIAPSERVVEAVIDLGRSWVSQIVHEYHHQLGLSHIWTRFGRLTDSPTQNLALRDEYDDAKAAAA